MLADGGQHFGSDPLAERFCFGLVGTENAKAKNAYQERYDSLTKLYKGIEGTDIDAELTADLVGDYLFTDADFVRSLSVNNRNVFQKVYDEIKYLCKIATAGSKEARQLEKVKRTFEKAYRESATEQTGTKYSLSDSYDYAKSFAEQLEDYQSGKIPKGDTLIVGGTPEVFRNIGMAALPVTINTSHVDYALNGSKDFDHQLGAELLAQLPEAIKNPVAIMTSGTKNTNSVVAMLEIRHNGKQVVVPVAVDGFGRQNGILIDSNAITSVYGKNNSISKVLADAITQQENGQFRLYYLDKNKAADLFRKARVPMPKNSVMSTGGYINSLTDAVSPVKRKISDVTESQQFKRWFGDWKNDPQNSSKIVNTDGTPKQMYHGSQEQFTVFDKTKAKSSGLYGRGFYFTDSESHAGQYGKTYSVYLNIKNPLMYGTDAVSRKQVRQYLNAVAENEDYSIENYGTYDVNEILNNIMGTKKTADAFSVIQDISATAIGDMVEATELFNTVNGTQFDGIVVPTETVAFQPQQIKSATDNIGTFDGNNPDIRFSLSSPVEETNDLIAVHNVSPEKLRAALKLGGLPSPSIAVTKPDISHDNYGGISLIFKKETIDPQTDSRNKVYGSDAWTPTISNARTEYEVDYDKMRSVEKNLADLSGQVANGIFKSDSLIRRLGVEDWTDNSAERLAERIAGTDEAKAAYLASQRKNIQPEHKEKVYSKFGNEALQTYLDSVGAQHLASVIADSELGNMDAIRAEENTVREIIRENYAQKHERLLARKPELREKRIDRYREKNVSVFISILRDIL